MSHDKDCGEARAAAPPTGAEHPAPATTPDVRFALRLIMLAGSERGDGSRGDPASGLLGRRDRIG